MIDIGCRVIHLMLENAEDITYFDSLRRRRRRLRYALPRAAAYVPYFGFSSRASNARRRHCATRHIPRWRLIR